MTQQTNSALLDAQGLLKNLEVNLSGKAGQLWLASLKKFLRKEQTIFPNKTNWPVWKTIKNVCPYKNANEVRNAFYSLGIEIWGRPMEMVKKLWSCTWNKEPQSYDVNLALVDIIDLGFSEDASVAYQEILDAAEHRGLRLCTKFDALQIRTLSTEQPNQQRCDEHWLIGMKPFKDKSVFELYAQHRIVLSSIFVRGTFNKHSRFVFRIG